MLSPGIPDSGMGAPASPSGKAGTGPTQKTDPGDDTRIRLTPRFTSWFLLASARQQCMLQNKP